MDERKIEGAAFYSSFFSILVRLSPGGCRSFFKRYRTRSKVQNIIAKGMIRLIFHARLTQR